MNDDQKKVVTDVATDVTKQVVTDVTKEQQKKNDPKDKGKDQEKKKGSGFGDALKKATIQNPSFWLTAGKAVLKLVKALNDDEWYGGDSTHYTYPSALAVRGGATILCVGALGRYICDVDKLINASMFEADVENIIKSYLTSVGREYTAQEVQGHFDKMVELMKADTKALSIVECYLRYNNSRAVPITKGITLEKVLSEDARAAIGGNCVDPRASLTPALRRRVLPVQYSSISNDSWSTDYRPRIGQLYTNPRLKGLIEYLYGSFFAGDITAGVNGNIYVDHSALERFQGSGTDTMKAAIDQALAKHDEIMASDVLLDELITYIGWSQVGTSDHYKRDPLASTYKLNADPEFIAALNNGDIFFNTRYAQSIEVKPSYGRYLKDLDRFIMLVPSGDISMSYSKDDLTTELSLGLIGEYMKFMFMEGHWSDVVILQNKNGAVSIANTEETQHAVECFNYSPRYAITDAAAGVEATNSYLTTARNIVSDKLGIRDWHDYFGIENTADYMYSILFKVPSTTPTKDNLGVAQIGVFGTTGTPASWIEPAGSDVVELNNFTQVKELICNNITLGVNFYEQAQLTLRRYAKAAKDR